MQPPCSFVTPPSITLFPNTRRWQNWARLKCFCLNQTHTHTLKHTHTILRYFSFLQYSGTAPLAVNTCARYTSLILSTYSFRARHISNHPSGNCTDFFCIPPTLAWGFSIAVNNNFREISTWKGKPGSKREIVITIRAWKCESVKWKRRDWTFPEWTTENTKMAQGDLSS